MVEHHYSLREEIANAITHGIGVLASIIGGAVLITLAAVHGDAWQVVAASVFVTALVLLYTASTLYHAIPNPTAKRRLKVLDHCAIFLLIAGTYTPFTLIGLRGSWGWLLFGVIWSLAVAGIAFKLFFTGRFKRTSTLIYVAMGWLIILAIGPLVRSVPAMTGSGLSVRAIWRSAPLLARVVVLALLLPGVGSVALELAVAVPVSVESLTTVRSSFTTTVKLAFPPAVN